MSNDLTKNIAELNSSAKEYFKVKVDLIKISLLEKTTKLTAVLINFWIITTLLIFVLTFVVAAFAVWYGMTYNNFPGGLLIAGCFLLLVTLLFYVLRKKIITTTVLRYYSEIILNNENDEEDE